MSYDELKMNFHRRETQSRAQRNAEKLGETSASLR